MNKWRKPTRLEELTIKNLLGRQDSFYERTTIHSIKDTETSLEINMETFGSKYVNGVFTLGVVSFKRIIL